jgi:hypothetical protein
VDRSSVAAHGRTVWRGASALLRSSCSSQWESARQVDVDALLERAGAYVARFKIACAGREDASLAMVLPREMQERYAARQSRD